MVQTELDPVQAFKDEAAQRAEVFQADAEKSARALHAYSAKVRAYDNLDDAGKEVAINRVRDMLAVELAVKVENVEGITFTNREDALTRGHEILDTKTAELQLETLDA